MPAPDPDSVSDRYAKLSDVVELAPGKRALTKAANRSAILDAAREVFSEMGFEAATVRDIIRRTGLSVGAFYNYYRSKEEVFDALADDGARRFRPILQAQSAQATDFPSYLRAAVGAYFNFLATEHELWTRGLEAETSPIHVRNTPELAAVFEEVRRAFAATLDRTMAAEVDLDFLAASAIAVAREVGDLMLRRRPMDVTAATEFVVSLISGGVTALPGPEH